MSVDTQEPVAKPKVAAASELKQDVQQLSTQVLDMSEEFKSLTERLRITELELAAARSQGAPADQILASAKQVLDRLENERKRGGKYKWKIQNTHFKNRRGEPAEHVFYSNEQTERGAIDDFKRRTGAQWDQTDRRGGDPFKAVAMFADQE
jgi:vacuolar-type H+-ATPase subunit I/STV1